MHQRAHPHRPARRRGDQRTQSRLRGRELGAGEVKFTGEVGPDVKLVTYEIDIKRVIKRKLVMAIGDARLLADGKEIYVANDLRVGLFKREEDGKDAA